jgi:hypothetical protein
MDYNFELLENVYYVTPYNKELINCDNLLIDNNKQIVPYSTFYSTYSTNVNEDKINVLSKSFINFNDVTLIDEHIIMITYWPHCYGHIYDSLYHFYVFSKTVNHDGKFLLWIPPSNNNVINLANILFGDKLINAEYFEHNKLVKLKKLTLIKNHTDMPYFFNYNYDNFKITLRDNYNDNSVKEYENVFLTRSVDTIHNKNSTIDNLKEVEDFFYNHNFKVINPDHVTNKQLYNHIKNAKNIVLTNGSVLSNLIIINPVMKVFCLNSMRYLPRWRKNCKNEKELEDIINNNPTIINNNFEKKLWRNTTSAFDFVYIDSFMNIITSEQMEFIINNIKL